MTQSVELLLDAGSETGVRQQWQLLRESGLPSMADHTGGTNRPHVTLGVADQIPEAVDIELGGLVAQLPLRVRLGGLVCFGGRKGGRQVLARLVVPGPDLLELQGRASAMMRNLPGTARHFRTGAWTAHVTLANGLTPEQVGAAVRRLDDVPEEDGEAVALRRWDSLARRVWLLG